MAIPSLWLWLGCCAFRQHKQERKLIAGGWSGGFQIYSYLFPFCSSTKTSFNRSRFYLFFSSFSVVQLAVTDAKAFKVEKNLWDENSVSLSNIVYHRNASLSDFVFPSNRRAVTIRDSARVFSFDVMNQTPFSDDISNVFRFLVTATKKCA